MTSNYDDFPEYIVPSSEGEDANLDCFELLSAYIDGEATAGERKQVQYWLDNDPQIKQTYLQLLKIQGGMQNLAVPTSETLSSETLSERVFATVDRRSRHKKAIVWGGAIAATIISAFAGIVPSSLAPSARMAEKSPQNNHSHPMMVAVSLNKPAVVIPKAAVSITQEQKRI